MNHMAGAGAVPISCEVMVFHDTGRSKGWGLVTYSTFEEAQQAVQELDGSALLGRNIWVKFDGAGKGSGRSGAEGKGAGGRRNNGRNQGYGGKGGGQHAGEVVVHVDNLPASANWKGLKDLFAPFGVLFSAVNGRNGRVRPRQGSQVER